MFSHFSKVKDQPNDARVELVEEEEEEERAATASF